MNNPNFDQNALIPTIIQDYDSSKVLMLAYMNQEAFELTVQEKVVHFYSRSRKRLWKKGESSGHIQEVKEIFFDCDEDTILIKVLQIGGAACHEGYNSCFYRTLDNGQLKIVETKVFDPKEVYKDSVQRK